MKRSHQLKALAAFVCAFLVSTIAFGQMKGKKILSPRDSVSGTIDGAAIKIAYGSPSVRGRKIWGGLVPYGKAWRTGANQKTIFETSKALKIEGKTLPAGKYSLFTVPGEKEWKIIFNSVTDGWGIKQDGSANDDPSKDVLTVMVKPRKSSSFSEHMVFKIGAHDFALIWENLEVPVMVK